MNSEFMVKPVKVIEVPGTPIKIHVKGLHPRVEGVLSLLKAREFNNQEERDRAIENYTIMYITHSIKKIEGVSYKGKDFNEQLKFFDKTEGTPDERLTYESYAAIDLLFSKKVKVNFFQLLEEAHNQITEELCDDFEILDDKKKDSSEVI